MQIKVSIENGHPIAVVRGAEGEKIIVDTQSALDLIMTIQYAHQADRVALDKNAIEDAFFILSTGMAGEVLQKFINYGVKAAIYGDYSHYTSKPLKDFIRESNRGNDFFFVPDEIEAVRRLGMVR